MTVSGSFIFALIYITYSSWAMTVSGSFIFAFIYITYSSWAMTCLCPHIIFAVIQSGEYYVQLLPQLFVNFN